MPLKSLANTKHITFPVSYGASLHAAGEVAVLQTDAANFMRTAPARHPAGDFLACL
jgi:hypothetical protein